ncbi:MULTISPECIES: PRC-barrel domain-containing protein [unclassified Brevundimonas]|uniref:PRC-barrel domain-containing protein n=1 Tax=unclassified Brevundimonas TaxID=2622653 RepID=UPI0025BDB482|nr:MULTISPECIES: PRC-barrel domain-containing protein [unclassified Brevundimonas]
MKTSLMMAVAAVGVLGLGACDNSTNDVVRAPAPDMAPEPLSRDEAKAATNEAALALGMTRKALEDADLVNAQGQDLGDVESLVTDASGTVTHFVVELDGPGDVQVLLPLAQVKAETRTDGKSPDLVTQLTSGELAALPRYNPPR